MGIGVEERNEHEVYTREKEWAQRGINEIKIVHIQRCFL